MAMHAAEFAGVGVGEPLARYPLLVTSDITEAEVRGAPLLSQYRLGVRREPSFNARVNGCSLGGVDLLYVDFGATDVEIASAALDDRFGIVIPLAGAMRLRYKHREFGAVPGSSAVIISPDDEFRMTWRESFSSLVLRIERSNFLAFARAVAPDSEFTHLTFDPVISRPAALRSVHGALEVVHECVARAGSADRVPALMAGRVREQLVTTLLTMQPNNLTGVLYQPSERIGRRAVRDAIDLVETEAGILGTVAQLARRVGVTARALQIGFQRELGVSPASYMRNVRLTRAHEALLVARPGEDVTVGDVAARWGFQHPGRFAVYYRQRYGETPSETLRKARI